MDLFLWSDRRKQVFCIRYKSEDRSEVFELPHRSPKEFAEHLFAFLRESRLCPQQLLKQVVNQSEGADALAREDARLFLNWLWLAECFQPREAIERNLWLTAVKGELLKAVLNHPMVEFVPQDRYLQFILHEDASNEEVVEMPRDCDAFCEAFLRWWRADEEAMRTILTEIWKFLHPKGVGQDFKPDMRYELATYFIEAMDYGPMRSVRLQDEELSWHYCAWHRLRWELARELEEERQEKATLEWIEVCYRTEPTEPAMVTAWDAEKEIRKALGLGEGTPMSQRGDGIPHFLTRREQERQTLTRLAHWFVRRYDLPTAFQIIGISFWGFLFFLLPFQVFAALALFVPRWWTFVLFILPLVVPVALNRGKCLKLGRMIGRLMGGCVIGWLPIVTEEWWRLALTNPIDHYPWIDLLPIAAFFVVVGYICLEARRFLPHNWVSSWGLLKRSFEIALLGLLLSALIGLFLCRFAGPAVLKGIKEQIRWHCRAPLLWFLKGLYVSSDDGVFPLAVLLIHSPLALFIGIFIQILWEEKPLTEPL